MSDDAERRIALAERYLEIGRPSAALDAIGPVVAAEPENAEALTVLAAARLAASQFDEAVAAASDALAADPRAERAFRVRALALARLGRADEARSSAAAAVRAEPNWWVSHDTAAQVDLITKRVTTATLESTAAAISLQPDSAEPLATRGDVLAALKRWEESAATFRRALSVDAQSGRAKVGLARAEFQLDRVERSSGIAAGHLRDDPQSLVARYYLCVPLLTFLAQLTLIVGLLTVLLALVSLAEGGRMGIPGLVAGGGVTLFFAFRNYRRTRKHAVGFGGYMRVLPRWPRIGVVACVGGLIAMPVALVAVLAAVPADSWARLGLPVIPVVVAVGGAVLMFTGWLRAVD
ncbi:tetratricopeptide repeat protein [Schumannella luteola]|jgi:tetratricopeptide (TPR) repeat protein